MLVLVLLYVNLQWSLLILRLQVDAISKDNEVDYCGM